MKFGEKVRLLRNEKKLSQTELGKMCGLSLRTIRNYDVDGRYPKQREVYDRLAKELDVDVNYLRTENEVFMEEVGSRYGRRGVLQAKDILEQTAQLFAGGSLSDEDELAFITEMQRLYLDSKERAKKYTPKKYLQVKQPDEE